MIAAELRARKDENSRLLREDLAARRTVLRGLPEIIALHTTEKCNLRCTMCVRSLGQGKIQLPRERLAVVCDQLFPTARKVALSAAAGEPMLADFDLILDRALAHGVRVDLVTNGSELTAEAYREAAPVLDHVNVSVDCCVPDVYERVRAGARFSKLDANLRAVREERRARPGDVLLSLSAVVMRSTLPHLPRLVGYARELEVDGLIVQRLYHSGKAVPEEEADPAAIAETFEAARAEARRAGLNVSFSDFGEPPELASPIRDKVPPPLEGQGTCWYVAQHLGVQPTGEVYPCCYPTDHRLGDLTRQSPEEVWNGRAAQRLRAAHYSGRGTLFCSGCAFAPHLAARRPAWLVERLRAARLRRAHARNERRRERLERAAEAAG